MKYPSCSHLLGYINLVLLGLLPTLQIANAYHLDNSCTPAQKEFLHRGLRNAIAMINEAVLAMKIPDTDHRQWQQWLFGKDTSGVWQAWVQGTLDGLSKISGVGKIEDAGQVGNDDLIIFCDGSRRVKTSRRKLGFIPWTPEYHDPAIGEDFNLKDHKLDCRLAFAWTWVPKDWQKPSVIEVCPWFLDYAMKQDYKFQYDVEPGKQARIAKALDVFVTDKLYSPFDLFGLFDNVLIYELTHTRPGGETEDVDGWHTYGWKNCKKLDEKPEGTKVAHKNADSITLYVSAYNLLRNGVKINEDGRFLDPFAQFHKPTL